MLAVSTLLLNLGLKSFKGGGGSHGCFHGVEYVSMGFRETKQSKTKRNQRYSGPTRRGFLGSSMRPRSIQHQICYSVESLPGDTRRDGHTCPEIP